MLLLALLLSTALHDEADYAAAADRYRDLDYEQALLTFERLSIRPDLTPAEKAEVLLWMALCYDGVGDAGSAEHMMREALERDRHVAFPVKASPGIVQKLEELRSALPAETTAAPPPPPPPPVDEPPTPPPFPWVAVSTTAGAAVALVGAGALGWLAADRYAAANDKSLFVDERQAHYGEHVLAFAGAVTAGVVGAGLAGFAGYLWVTRSEP
jgi:hypothetical protein